MKQTRIIAQVQSLYHQFDDVLALNDASLSIYSGEILAILGPNGAGKSSLIHLLLGYLKLQKGQLEILGGAPGDFKVKRRIGVAMQQAGLPGTIKVREYLELFMSYYPNPLTLEHSLSFTGLEKLADRAVAKLSGGEKQRVLLAIAICGNPDLVFLDEPTVGLDVNVRHHFWEMIRNLSKQGKTIVLTTHYIEEAEMLADRVILLNQGTIISEGTPEKIKRSMNGTLIRFRSDKRPESFLNYEGIIEANAKGGYLVLSSNSKEASLRALLDDEDMLPDLTVANQSLEDIFMRLTQSHD